MKLGNIIICPRKLRAAPGKPFAIAALAFVGLLPAGFGAGDTWLDNPASGNWNSAANWSPATVPNGSGATATFSASKTTSVSISGSTQVGSIVFSSTATVPYTITVDPTVSLTVSGAGILNNSGTTQNFVAAVNSAGQAAAILFTGTGYADSAVNFTIDGATAAGAAGATLVFTASTYLNAATITTNAGTGGGNGAVTSFTGMAQGDYAAAVTNGNGVFDISADTESYFYIGSIAGSGTYELGGGRMVVGYNNLSTTVTGVITGGTGASDYASLYKEGTGTLTIAGLEECRGSTVVESGTLIVTGTVGVAATTEDGGFSVASAAVLQSGALYTSKTYIGEALSGTSAFIQTGGIHGTGELLLGDFTAGSYLLSGGTLSTPTVEVGGGNSSGTDVFTQTGGVVAATGAIDVGVMSTGSYALSKGSISAGGISMGGSGSTGTFLQTGGTNTIIGKLQIASGTYTLGGGVLNASSLTGINGGSGDSVFNFNGGALVAQESSEYFDLLDYFTTASVQAGGAFIHDNGFNVVIGQPLIHDPTPGAPALDGGLTVTGSGSVTLTGTNTYTGPTVVKSGALILHGGGTLGGTAVTVGSGSSAAALEIAGGPCTISASNVTLEANAGSLSMADGVIDTLTIGRGSSTAALILGGDNAITLDVSGTQSDSIALAGNGSATVIGTNYIVPVYGSLSSGTDVLIVAPGGGLAPSGAFLLGAKYAGTQTLISTGTALILEAQFNPAPPIAYFTGTYGSVWNTIVGSGTAGQVNFSSDSAGATNTGQLPFLNTDVHLYATGANTANLVTTLGQNFSIDSLTLDGTATLNGNPTLGESRSFSIAGNTLTITGSTSDFGAGITLNPGAGALTITSAVVVGASQLWINASQSTLTVAGPSISGAGFSIEGSGTTVISVPEINTNGLTLNGNGALTLSGNSSINGALTAEGYGTLLVSGSVTLPQGGDANISGANLIVTGSLGTTGNLTVDEQSGYTATATLKPGGAVSADFIIVGNNGAATFTQTGGINNTAELYLAQSASSSGTYQLSGGSLTAGDFYVGESGSASVIQSGGAATVSDELNVGDGGSGLYKLSSGALTAYALNVAYYGPGTFIQTGGTTTATYETTVGYYGEAGAYTLGGGVLITPAVAGGGSADLFNFGGGTLEAGASSTAFISGLGSANVRSGGAIINSNGYNVTIGQALVHDTTAGAPAIDGGLTKLGAGTLTLTGSNNYTGFTDAGAGTLLVPGSLASTGSASVASGAVMEIDGLLNPAALTTVKGTLQGSGTVGRVQVDGFAAFAPGDNSTSTGAGVLTAEGNVVMNGTSSTFNIRLGVATAADHDELVMGSGNVTLGNATLKLSLGVHFMAQAPGFIYVLIDGQPAGSTISGAFAQGSAITVDDEYRFAIEYARNATNTGSGDDVLLISEASIPEPGSWALIGTGVAIVAAGRRRAQWASPPGKRN